MVVAKHKVEDQAKFEALVSAMANGWPVGMPPVLVAGDNEALTGSHRIAAAEAAGIEVETINVQDAVEALVEEGYDWDDFMRMDDYELAATFRSVGRDDLAEMAMP